MNLTFHTDPGHGWLFVSHLQLKTLGLGIGSFTKYSYHDEYGVYAEEDLDAGVVIKTHEKLLGGEPTITFVDHLRDAPFRNCARCTGNSDEVWALYKATA
jgi:hypothetical protein